MRRLILLAIGVALLLCTANVRTAGVPASDISKLFGVESSLRVGAPQPPTDADEQWRAPFQSTVSVSESFWKSPRFHAELAAAPTPRLFDPAPVASSQDPPARSVPHYLRHTPLLI